MGLFGNLFKSKEQKQAEAQAAARAEWAAAQSSGDEFALSQAASSLTIAGLHDEYVAAKQEMISRFPQHAAQYENDLGVQYWGEGNYDKAMYHYIRSYNLDDGGSCAESNIRELCQTLAGDEDDPQKAIGHLLFYFRICTKQIDPEATVEEIDFRSIFRSDVKSLADVRLSEAAPLFDEIEELLEEVDDSDFVTRTKAELELIAKHFGIERLDN